MKNKRFNHNQVWQLALPMIISNISTPLLGLVDTAVVGHLGTAHYLGGVALGSMLFSFIYWGLGFLRMGTTGLTAQVFGLQDFDETRAILGRAIIIALLLAIAVMVLQVPISWVGFRMIEGEGVTETLAADYFFTRIWSAPATLTLYVISGWFLGMQNVRSPLMIVLLTNSCNIALDILLVNYLDMNVTGVALASVIAEYIGLLLAVILVRRTLKSNQGQWQVSSLLQGEKLKQMLQINQDIFIRTLCLIIAFAFFTLQGAKLGELTLAANAVLMNFQMFMAFALDGFAHAVEALVGNAIGARDKRLFKQSVNTSTYWAFIIAIGFAVTYAASGEMIIALLTDIPTVRQAAIEYLPWQVFMPIIAVWCYVLDGIFIGATLSKEMRNTMLVSLLLVYFPIWYLSQSMANHGLWLTMTAFLMARGVTMGIVYLTKKERLIV